MRTRALKSPRAGIRRAEEARQRAEAGLRQALAEQTATAEILRVMAASPADVQPVFDAIAANAGRLCDASFCVVFRFDGELITMAADDGRSPGTLDVIRAAYPAPPGSQSMSARAIRERRVISIADAQSHPDRQLAARARAIGYRSILAVPMMKGDAAIGAINVVRFEAQPFSDAQIELLKTFADQAAIAIENVRLFNETKLSLEQQKASSEVLKAISGSMADTAPVFDKILESCQRLFAGTIVGLNLVGDDGMLHIGAYHGAHREEFERIFPIPVTADSGSGLSMIERRIVHYPDAQHGFDVPEKTKTGCKAIGIKSVLFTPVMWEGRGLGAIFIGRDRIRWFSESEMALLRTFADQAAIAIQNARQFNVTKEALEQQTATAEILAVTSGSPADVQPVFEAILAHTSKLCEASVGAVFLYDGEVLTNVAQRNASPEFARFMSGVRSLPSLDTTCRRCALERRTIHTADLLGDPEFAPPEAHRRENIRTVLSVPMLREGSLVGVITLWRREVRPFTAKQIALVETFAQQAVLAIESVRLINEIQEKSRQLAIASQHKSEFLANMSHELRTPLNAIIGFTRIVMRKEKERLEPLQYENLEKILSSGQHLLGQINSILDLSKIEAGRVDVRASAVGLAPVLEQCLRTVEPLVRAEAVSLVKEFDGGLPELYADEEKLGQIVLNLLSNAVKFTERGSIRLSAQAAGGAVTVAVADTGIGIPADKLDLIFDEFEQVDAKMTRAHGGTGLGLAIARRLARLMGGDIRADSTLGRGSTFTLTLPVRYPGEA